MIVNRLLLYNDSPHVPTAHVTPEPNEPAHALHGFCWCQPVYEDVGLDGRIYIHRRSLDSPHIEQEEPQ